jgi:hypothetical protein
MSLCLTKIEESKMHMNKLSNAAMAAAAAMFFTS